MSRDYRALGLKVGLEIHWELDTDRKLFCNCPPTLHTDEPDARIVRYHRAVPGETGEVDVAAQFETIKGRRVIYEIYRDCTCEVETDSTPPLPPDPEAVKTALEIALLLNARIVDEVHVMRKTIIDGSLPSGFQRTMLIAHDGHIDTSQGGVGISIICLEEDSGRIIKRSPGEIVFRLDRLGIPEVEIGTKPEIGDPEQAMETAERIGELLTSTGKVKRGLGVVRQDVNISIEGGARVEIKHIQRLGMIPKVIEEEVERQLNLLTLKGELEERGFGEEELDQEPINISRIFEGTSSKILRGKKIYALRIPRIKGIFKWRLQGERTFGREVAEMLQVKTGLKGFLHSDELPGYGVSKGEVEEVKRTLQVGDQDGFILVAAEEELARRAISEIVSRIREALKGVPKEVRRALPDATTTYTRPLPGAARMYPETDCIPIPVTEELLEEVRSRLPEPPEIVRERMVKEYGLSQEMASRLPTSGYLKIFEEIVAKYKGLNPTLVASTLLQTLPSLRREGFPVENLTPEHLFKIFEVHYRGRIAKEALPEILGKVAEDPSSLEEVVKGEALSRDEVARIIAGIVDENIHLVRERGGRAIKPLMGLVMKRLRGKYDGAEIHRILQATVKERL